MDLIQGLLFTQELSESSKRKTNQWCMEETKMMNENQIKVLLEDIKSVYLIGYFKDDLTTEAEKWGQIEILEQILSQKEIMK